MRMGPRETSGILIAECTFPMRLLIWFSRAFIDAFGITHPAPEQERKVAIFITSLLGFFVVLVMSVIVGMFYFGRH
jgi:hypothetical protein